MSFGFGDAPYKITLYNKTFQRLGWLGDPLSCEFIPRHNAIGSMTLGVRWGNPKLAFMLPKGSRIVVHYQGTQIMSGMMRFWNLNGGLTDGVVTISYTDDKAVFWETLGWPNPTQSIAAQNTGGVKEDKVTGPAETVAKTFLQRNAVTRLGNPITVAADQGRGTPITVSYRMVPLADNLITPVDNAGIGLSAQQTGSSIVVDAYVPRVYPHTLSELSGIVLPGSLSYTEGTATRTVVAGPGVGTSREWLERVNTGPAKSTDYNRHMEVLTDASSTDVTTERQQAGDDTLTAAGPKSGYSIGLSERGAFRYPNIAQGDQLSLDLGAGLDPLVDVIREVTLRWDRDNGPTVGPTVGERTDDPAVKLARYLSAVARKVRKLTTT